MKQLLIYLSFFFSFNLFVINSFAQFYLREAMVLNRVEEASANASLRQPQNISVPVKIGGPGLTAVSRFKFIISYNAGLLAFEGVNPVAVSNVSSSASNGSVILNWENPSMPLNCSEQTILFEILFSRLQNGDATLDFQPGSFVGSNQSLYPVDYINGMLLQTYQLELQANPETAGAVSGGGSYLPGQAITVAAFPSNGYSFVNWTSNGQTISNDPVFTYTMPSAPMLLHANFTPNAYLVNLLTEPSQGGTVQGGGAYLFGQNVVVNATPSTGYAFLHWVKNGTIVSTNPSYQFNMPAENIDLWAVFDLIAYPLTISVNPAIGGQVSGAGNYFYNAPVTLQATSNVGYHFVSWQVNGTVVSTNPSYSFTMPPNAMDFVARFALNNYLIQVVSNNPEAGTVSGGGNFYHFSDVTVTATPASNFQFIAWVSQNEVVSYDAVYTFQAVQNIELTAIFQPYQECTVPIALDATNIGENTAKMRWISPFSIDSWDVLWGQMGEDTLATYNLVEGISNPFLLIDTLQPQTNYGFVVRSICEGKLYSAWSEMYLFSTYYVGIDQPDVDKEVKIYPNPANNGAYLQLNGVCDEILRVRLFDPSGRIFETDWQWHGKEIYLPLSAFSAGIYYLSVVCPETELVKPIVIMR